MSRRLLNTEAIILQTRKFGEIHKRITLLTPNEGIIYANAYGAAKGKSKLAGTVLPFSTLHINLYYDPVKNGYKITEAHPIRTHTRVHGNLKRYYAADMIAEVLLKSFGGGESEPFYKLISEALDFLETVEHQKIVYVLIQFLWRYIGLSGLAVDFDRCANCGIALHTGDTIFIDIINHGSFCPSCSLPNMVSLSRGGINYLAHTSSRTLPQSDTVLLDKDSTLQLFRLLCGYVEGIVEGKIHSIPLWEEQ